MVVFVIVLFLSILAIISTKTRGSMDNDAGFLWTKTLL